MARIVFYDVNERDKQQLEQAFVGSDHEVIIVTSELTPETMDTIAEVISVFVSSPVTADILAKSNNLRHIACRSTGYDHIDMEAARERNISVSNVPAYGSHTVAEYAMSLLLFLSRKLSTAIDSARQGVTVRQDLEGFDLYGKTLGIIGAGRIGCTLARIASGFGMRVLAYDPFPAEHIAHENSFEYTSIEQLLAQSDVVSLHAPYTQENHHLLNEERIAAMKRGSVVINTARGELIDNRALIDALESGHLYGAAVDVLEGEQLINTREELLMIRSEAADPERLKHSLEVSVLKKLPNVVVTNHNAFNTREAIARINHQTAENIHNFFLQTPSNIVS